MPTAVPATNGVTLTSNKSRASPSRHPRPRAKDSLHLSRAGGQLKRLKAKAKAKAAPADVLAPAANGNGNGNGTAREVEPVVRVHSSLRRTLRLTFSQSVPKVEDDDAVYTVEENKDPSLEAFADIFARFQLPTADADVSPSSRGWWERPS